VNPLAVETRRRFAFIAVSASVLAALLAITWWVYHPGLFGDFLFDDFGNLPAIGATGPVDNWATFWRYVTSGTADITGRPLTLLTFLIDARNWPTSPYPFKVTNVILHLINGVLLAWVLWKLSNALMQRRKIHSDLIGLSNLVTRPSPDSSAAEPETQPPVQSESRIPGSARAERGQPRIDEERLLGRRSNNTSAAIAAVFGAGVWLLHPLFVSTTLYIVQREAMLPATIVLLGMLGWMASREALARGQVRRAMAGMALSAWLCTVLATLSKANGALLPILLLLTEWIVLARRPMIAPNTRRWHRRAIVLFLAVPSSLVLAYLLYRLPGAIHDAPTTRGWSVGQRLLTEPRVITDYLRLLFIPHAYSSGLFNDQFAISTSWTQPASTLPCIVLVLALIAIGFALRNRYPAIALALLFYFAAQLMESGWIPLELYYEHRNYLPATLLFWPIGLAVGRAGTFRFLRVAASVVILAGLAGMTSQRATLWGDGFRQAQVWAAINPGSARAQANAALYDLQHDRPRLAAARLRLSMSRHPDDIQAPINLIGAECRMGGVQPQTLARAELALAHTRLGGQAAFKWFNEALDMASHHSCAGLDFAALQATLDAARRNPLWREQPGRQQDLDHMQGQLDLAEAKPQQALAAFNRALAISPTPGSALQQAAYFGAHGYPEFGLAHLDYFSGLPPGPKIAFGMPLIHEWVLREQGWWPKELSYLRKNLEEDAATKNATTGSGK
jgi:tetratricopeptide (TPR) repeat protein